MSCESDAANGLPALRSGWLLGAARILLPFDHSSAKGRRLVSSDPKVLLLGIRQDGQHVAEFCPALPARAEFDRPEVFLR